MICMFKVIHYCYLMYLANVGIGALKNMGLILLIFFLQTEGKLDLLTNADMLLM